MMPKQDTVEHNVNSLFQERWSPRAFTDRKMTVKELKIILEAGRWAASSFNEQPWRYIYAYRSEKEKFQQILSCLTEGNQVWAKEAAVLMLGFAKKTFSHNGSDNRFAMHDLGQASAYIALQAADLGLQAHQMAGIKAEKIKEEFDVPDDYHIGAALAIGETGPPSLLSDDLATRERKKRMRKQIEEFTGKESF